MTREEYMQKIDALEKEKHQIQEEYKNSMPVKPKQVVVINKKEYWLEKYYIVGYHIKPTLYEIHQGKIRREYGVAQIENWLTMRPKIR